MHVRIAYALAVIGLGTSAVLLPTRATPAASGGTDYVMVRNYIAAMNGNMSTEAARESDGNGLGFGGANFGFPNSFRLRFWFYDEDELPPNAGRLNFSPNMQTWVDFKFLPAGLNDVGQGAFGDYSTSTVAPFNDFDVIDLEDDLPVESLGGGVYRKYIPANTTFNGANSHEAGIEIRLWDDPNAAGASPENHATGFEAVTVLIEDVGPQAANLEIGNTHRAFRLLVEESE